MKRRLESWLNSASTISLAHATSKASRKPESSSSLGLSRDTSNGTSPIAIMVRDRLRVPSLTHAQIEELNAADQPQLVTRHIRRDLLQVHLEGSFRFGTIAAYKGTENRQLGRFGDISEGRQRTTYTSPSGYHEQVRIGGLHIENSYFSNDAQVVVESRTNDFCGCVSLGAFEIRRAEAIRDAELGNPDTIIGAYVTYDRVKLTEAIASVLQARHDLSSHRLIHRPVSYGHKDFLWRISSNFTQTEERAPLETWLDAAFVKPARFGHEEELRILIIDPASPGSLEESAEAITFMDERISGAIVAHGLF